MFQEGTQRQESNQPRKGWKLARLGELAKHSCFSGLLCASVHSWVSLQISFLCSFACMEDVGAHFEN